MDAFNQLLIEYGFWGMLIAAFLAGTFVPFSSEVVLTALLLTTDADAVTLVSGATVGNVVGTMFNYLLGYLCSRPGKLQRIAERWMPSSDGKSAQRAARWVENYGAWTGLLTFLPLLGTAIAVAAGLLRIRKSTFFLATFIGKTLRYIIIAWPIAVLTA